MTPKGSALQEHSGFCRYCEILIFEHFGKEEDCMRPHLHWCSIICMNNERKTRDSGLA